MRIFKNKTFSKWAEKLGLNDDALRASVDEMERGLINADELKALKQLAKELMNYSDKALTKAIQHGALIEVENNG